MSDAWVVILAGTTCLGAWWARPIPLWVAGAMAVIALAVRWPVLLCVAALLAAAGLSARAWAGTTPPPRGSFSGVVTLVDDPQPGGTAVHATVRADGHHWDAWAYGTTAAHLRLRLAGERVVVAGTVGPVPSRFRRRLAERHISAQLQLSFVGDTAPANPVGRAANVVRRTLVAGASSMPPAERALFTGFVLGDDRDEPPQVVAEFQASGLVHLTAVSGENLAFLLVLAGPLLRRLGLRARYGATVALVAWFALLTRFEPSVLRAGAMAALAATSFFLARPVSTVRLLALAVAALVLIDPLLVWSVGWWLSVGATAGIALAASPIAAHLPGPRVVAETLAVTIAAQVGVAPVAIAVFGGVPVISVVANALAVPVAGPLMVWGLPGGLAAGLLPASVATVLHVPTRLGVRWIALVARVSAAAPLGQIRLVHVPFLAAAVAVAAAVRHRRRVRSARAAKPP
jgi:competence protein ComEC